MIWGGELILRDGAAAGQLTSGAWGRSLGACVGPGYVRHPAGETVTADFLRAGHYEVNVSGQRVAATRAPAPAVRSGWRAGQGSSEMTISAFDLFKIGIGPSSSHTVGPMRAAAMFVTSLAADGLLGEVTGVEVELFGSLGATGHGHGSVKAVVLGLAGELPETVDPEAAEPLVASVRSGRLRLLGRQEIDFDIGEDVILHRRKRLPFHSNAMRFAALGRGRGRARRAVLLLGRRRVRARRGRGGQSADRAGRHGGALSVHDRRGAAGAHSAHRAADQRGHAGQRAGLRGRGRGRGRCPGRPAAHLGALCRNACSGAARPRACCPAA